MSLSIYTLCLHYFNANLLLKEWLIFTAELPDYFLWFSGPFLPSTPNSRYSLRFGSTLPASLFLLLGWDALQGYGVSYGVSSLRINKAGLNILAIIVLVYLAKVPLDTSKILLFQVSTFF